MQYLAKCSRRDLIRLSASAHALSASLTARRSRLRRFSVGGRDSLLKPTAKVSVSSKLRVHPVHNAFESVTLNTLVAFSRFKHELCSCASVDT